MKYRLVALAVVWVSSSGAGELDGRDAVLAELGRATLECLGTVGPATYDTQAGFLRRTFTACRSGDRDELRQLDALLAVQLSEFGRADKLAEHYVSRWDAFTTNFAGGRRAQCPTWELENVLDAPTQKSVPRFVTEQRVGGKENYRYAVASSQCSDDGECAVKLAAACAAGFGPAFIADLDPRRSRVEVDPAWWLTTYDFPKSDNPFLMPGYYHAMSFYGELPGALYGAIQRAGEPCSQWSERAGKHYTDRVLVPIDCGGGWMCMTYCTSGPHSE